ncbi:MAG: ATP-binding protein [Nitrospirota bacterium]
MSYEKKVNVLVVDDNLAELLAYETILGDLEGINLVIAHSGKEALAFILKMEFAVIITDVNMPIMDGFEMANLIRKKPQAKDTPIIFASATLQDDIGRLKGYASGAVDYIFMPVIPEILKAKVMVFVELFKKRQQIEKQIKELEDEIKERKRAEQELKATQNKLIQLEKVAAVSQIASEAAHEIKNPLAVIKAGLYYLKKILPEDDEAQKTLSQMDNATRRATTYINDLLNFSRPPVLALKPVDVHKIIEDSINELLEEILAGIEIEKDFAPDVPLLNADADRLKQVFANLIKNGAEAMGEKVESRKLKVESGKDGEFVKISISDTGKGISEEDLNHIFDPFFTTKGKGTGLELAICQRIIEAHKGEIEVKSAVGKGTIFVVKLPGYGERLR